jgi:hypothetical protein
MNVTDVALHKRTWNGLWKHGQQVNLTVSNILHAFKDMQTSMQDLHKRPKHTFRAFISAEA